MSSITNRAIFILCAFNNTSIIFISIFIYNSFWVFKSWPSFHKVHWLSSNHKALSPSETCPQTPLAALELKFYFQNIDCVSSGRALFPQACRSFIPQADLGSIYLHTCWRPMERSQTTWTQVSVLCSHLSEVAIKANTPNGVELGDGGGQFSRL